MGKFTYRATDAAGTRQGGRVQAGSIAEARTLLEGRGFSDVRVLSDELAAAASDHWPEPAGFDDKLYAEIFERSIERPGVGTVLRVVASQSRLLLAGCAGATIVALALGLPTWVAALPAAVVVLGAIYVLQAARPVANYNELHVAHTRGEWDRVLAIGDRLLAGMRSAHEQNTIFDVQMRQAYALAKQGKLEEALARVARWEHLHPVKGTYANRLALVYHAAGDLDRFVALMERACDEAGRTPSVVVDAALAHARCGVDVALAQRLLDEVREQDLPPAGPAFVAWTRGMIALRRGDAADAERHLVSSLQGLMPMAANPVAWTTLALVTGSYAVALAATGRRDRARSVAQPVYDVLRLHADAPLLARVDQEVI